MSQTNMEELVTRLIQEICSNHTNLDTKRIFSVFIYDPLQGRSQGQGIERISLGAAIRTLHTRLQEEMTYIGQILVYRPKRQVFYEKRPGTEW